MTGSATPERNVSDRVLSLERQVEQLRQQLHDRRVASQTPPQPVRLAVTVRAINPDYDSETPGSSPTLPYPEPDATLFPIRFLDALNNPIPANEVGDPAGAADFDLDFDGLDRGDDGTANPPPQTYALHAAGEYVPLGTVVQVLFQRPVQGPAEDRLAERVQWFIEKAVDGAVAIRNDYGAEIPARSLVRLTGPDPDEGGVMLADRPDDATDSVIAVVGRWAIPDGAVGLAWEDARLHVFKTATSFASGEEPEFADATWGAQEDSFEAAKGSSHQTKIEVFKNLGTGTGKIWGRFKAPKSEFQGLFYEMSVGLENYTSSNSLGPAWSSSAPISQPYLYPGAYLRWGDEAATGIALIPDVSTPSTEGIWEVTKTGLYRLILEPLLIFNSSSGATFDEILDYFSVKYSPTAPEMYTEITSSHQHQLPSRLNYKIAPLMFYKCNSISFESRLQRQVGGSGSFGSLDDHVQAHVGYGTAFTRHHFGSDNAGANWRMEFSRHFYLNLAVGDKLHLRESIQGNYCETVTFFTRVFFEFLSEKQQSHESWDGTDWNEY